MKRKITQIGRFFAMAALMLGAASWASAQEHPSPSKIGKKACTQSWNFNTSWAEDSLKFATNADYWAPTVKGDTVQRYATLNDSKIIKNGELAFTPEGSDLISKTKGLIFTNLENSSGWKKNHITFRIHMDPGLNCIQTGKKVKLGFKESPKVGEIIEIVFQSANATARGWASWTGVEPLFEGDADAHDGKVETRKWRVTAENPTFSSNNAIMLHKILVYSETETAPIHVTYLGDEPVNYEPVHEALTALKAKEDNKLEITYKGITADSKLTLEEFEGTDVLVVGSTVTGDNKAIYATLDALVGKLPILNTKVFWYKTKRLDWGDAANNDSEKTDCIVPQAEYKDHPLFAGLVKGTVADRDTIKVINDFDNTQKNPTRYLQGYTVINDNAPAHTLLGVSTGKLNAFAESWSRGCPYMLIAIDSDMKDKGKPALTDNGKQIIANAINYLANATVQQPAGTLGTCGDPEITFEKVKADGNTDSDTMRYVVKITVAKVQNAAGEGEIDPTVMITIGSGAAKEYDFDHPDTIWESCTVKAKATALLYEDSKEVSAEFTANLREMPAPVFKAEKVEGKGYKVSFKTYETTIDNEVTQPTIKYSLDGSAPNATYDPAKDSIIPSVTAIVKAQASLMYYKQSEISDTVWSNPDVDSTSVPTINASNVAGLFTITSTGEEGSKIYYTMDGSDPRTSSTKQEYNYAIECEVFENPVTVKACALADGKGYSNVVEEVLKNDNVITLTTPTIAVGGGSFTISSVTEGAQAGSYAIYYTIDGSEPDTNNGLIYTDKVTYKGGDKFKVKAIAAGRGYKQSAVATSEDVTPTGEVDVCGKLNYYSTFNRNDPSVRYDDRQNPDNQTWGWFRWVPSVDDPSKWDKTPGNHSQLGSNGNKYLTQQEYDCGVYYDGEGSPRPQIFTNDNKGDWRKFNDWVFWKDTKKGTNGKYRRILVQNGMAPKEDKEGAQALPGFSGGALYIFNSAVKADAGPDSLFQGPFAVVINISGADKLAGAAADVNVCVANTARGANEMVLGKVSCEAKAGKSDTVYYYGDQKVYVRLTTESESVLVFDFQVFKPGAALPTLTHTGITPEAGLSFEESKVVTTGTKEITVTFNNEISVNTETQPYLLPLKESGEFDLEADEAGKGIDGKVSLGSDKKSVVITLDRAIDAADGQMYYSIVLPEATAADADNGVDYRNKHTNDKITMYYKVDGVTAIDEVSAAKEVVATYIYSISGAQMTTLAPGVNIVKKVYSDGTTTTEKVQAK